MRDVPRFPLHMEYCALLADRSIDVGLEVGELTTTDGNRDNAYRPWTVLTARRNGLTVKVTEPIKDGDLDRAARAIRARLH